MAKKTKGQTMAFWRITHLYCGLVLFALLFVIAASGSILVFENDLLKLGYRDIPDSLPQMERQELAGRLDAIADHYRTRFPDARISIGQPTEGLPVFHVRASDVEAFVHPESGQVIDEWHWYERPLSFIYILHHFLLAGEPGMIVVGFCGLFGTFMLVGGLVLWWPARHRFQLSHLLPRDSRRKTLIRLHRELGLLSMPMLFIVLLTGAGIIFNTQAQILLNGLFGDSPKPRPAISADATGNAAHGGADILSKVHDALPQADLRFYIPPMPGSAVHQFRLRMPSEWHPDGRSYVFVNGETGAILHRINAEDLPPGEKAYHALYPLHGGFIGGLAYKLFVFFSGLALMILSLSGFLAYLRRSGKPRTDQGRAQRRNRLA